LTALAKGPTTAIVPKDLAALLVEEGAVRAAEMERAVLRQSERGGALDTALFELGAVDEARLVSALSRATDLPPAPAHAWEAADARARRVFPSRVAERHGLAPFALDGRELALVASYPVDLGLLDEISFMLSLHLTAHVGPEWRVRALIQRLYGGALDPRFAALAAAGGAAAPSEEPEAPGPAGREEAVGGPAAPTVIDLAAQSGERPAPEKEPPPGPPPMVGFARDANEPLEPLAAALAQALESDDFPWLDDALEDLGPGPAAGAAEAAGGAAHPGAPPEPPLDRSAPPRFTLEQARAAAANARSRDELVLVALRYARDFFEFAALFAVTRDAVAGHDALGPQEDARDLCRGTAIYTSDPGIFRTVIDTRAPYLGPVAPGLSGNEAILSGLGRGNPRTVLVCPVVLRGRAVCVLYADNGEAPVSARRLGDLLLFLATVGASFERLIRERKSRGGKAPPAPPEGPPSAPETAAALAPPRTPAPPPQAAPAPPPVAVPAPPPDDWRTREPAARLPDFEIDVEDDGEDAAARGVGGEIARLVNTSPGSPRRAQSVARLAAQGEAAVEALVAALPGPVEDEHAHEPAHYGPVPAALSLHGAAAVPLLLGVLQEADPSRRRAAAVLLGAAAEPAAFGPLADRALDADPRVAHAAAEALGRNRGHPAMHGVPDRLRRALLSGVAARTAGAARALGALRDLEAIPLLIQVLETTGGAAAEAAGAALERITLQRHGTDARRWLGWWKQNRGRGRAEWLFSGLTSADRTIREAAAVELSAAAPSPVQYSPDAAPAEREAAARAWAGWWARSGRVL